MWLFAEKIKQKKMTTSTVQPSSAQKDQGEQKLPLEHHHLDHHLDHLAEHHHYNELSVVEHHHFNHHLIDVDSTRTSKHSTRTSSKEYHLMMMLDDHDVVLDHNVLL